VPNQGIPVSRSTMNELLHHPAAILEPLWRRLRDVILIRPVVMADETRLRIVRDKHGKTKNGFVWTFGARDDAVGLDVGYVFAEDRSGSTPKNLLEGTSGVLLVDGYSGYNAVETVSTRRRAACHAHLRRYFHEALPTLLAAQELLELVAELAEEWDCKR
jgi:transposase